VLGFLLVQIFSRSKRNSYSLTFFVSLSLCLFEFTSLLLFEATLFSFGLSFSLVSSFLFCLSAFSIVVRDCIRCVRTVFAVSSLAGKAFRYLLAVLFSSQSVFIAKHELFSTQATVAIHVRSGFPGIFLSLFIFFGS